VIPPGNNTVQQPIPRPAVRLAGNEATLYAFFIEDGAMFRHLAQAMAEPIFSRRLILSLGRLSDALARFAGW
jgi:hypothetical protein